MALARQLGPAVGWVNLGLGYEILAKGVEREERWQLGLGWERDQLRPRQVVVGGLEGGGGGG